MQGLPAEMPSINLLTTDTLSLDPGFSQQFKDALTE